MLTIEKHDYPKQPWVVRWCGRDAVYNPPSWFKRKRDAQAFVDFLTAKFGDRLNAPENVDVSFEEKLDVYAEVHRLHAAEQS